jgi:hypothetical protein
MSRSMNRLSYLDLMLQNQALGVGYGAVFACGKPVTKCC